MMSIEDINGSFEKAHEASGSEEILQRAASLPEEVFEARLDDFLEQLKKIGIKYNKTFLRAAIGKRRKEAHQEARAQKKAVEAAARQASGEIACDRTTLYRVHGGGLVLIKDDGDVSLTNFTAKITKDVTIDDGSEDIKHEFQIDAAVRGRIYQSFSLPAGEFSRMEWVAKKLGADAIIHVGHKTVEHARNAIQAISVHDVERRVKYGHLGWRQIKNEWVYLHAGGALGAQGQVDNIHVSPRPEFASFQLPAPPTDPREAIRASLRFLDLGPDHITIPLYAAIWRAIIGGPDFSEFVYGKTGGFKTEISTLIQRHFGAGFSSRRLPASFTSTANFNEDLAFLYKDAVMVVDDYHPTGSRTDRERMERDAARFFRSQGNQAGRGRMASDRSLKWGKWPRCLPIATGEDLIGGQSLNSRLLILEIRQDDITEKKLSACQHDADAGLYAQATAAFITWAAKELPVIQQVFQDTVSVLQKVFTEHHPRAGHIRAQLTATYAIFLHFLLEHHVIRCSELANFQTRIGNALRKITELQTNYGAETADPCARFRELLLSAVSSGAAHLASPDGSAPSSHEAACGWRKELIAHEHQWRPQGTRIGWVRFDTNSIQLYLDPAASYVTAKKMATDGSGIEVTDFTLRRRLHEAKQLASDNTKTKRRSLTIRRIIEGGTKDVLNIKPEFLNLVQSKDAIEA
jgi:hypothetical protein